jgi:hypothetical protein
MTLAIVTVAQPVRDPVRPGTFAQRRFGPDGDADGYLESLVAEWSGSAPEVTGTVLYDPKSPADGLREHLPGQPGGFGRGHDPRRTGIERVLLGSEAARTVQQSPAPAHVVPVHAD